MSGRGYRKRARRWLWTAIAIASMGCGDDPRAPAPFEVDGGWVDGAALDGGAVADGEVGDGWGADGAMADAGGPGPAYFEDVTATSGMAFDRVPADAYRSIADRVSAGVCVIDADGSPPLDLFFPIRPSVSGGSRLYIAQGPFDYRDETADRGLSAVGDAVACLAFDAEGDGDDDLLVTGVGTLQLFLQDGGNFEDASGRLPGAPHGRGIYASAAAGDLDGDGDLDLVIAGYTQADPRPDADCGGLPCAVHIVAHAPIGNLLLVRQDDGSYLDRTLALAPPLADDEPTLMVAITDLDRDDLADIYVGNDLGTYFPNRPLVRGRDGVFNDDGVRVGLTNDRSGHGIDTMGWALGDLDGDLRMEHVTTSFQGYPTSVFFCGDDLYCEDRSDLAGTAALSGTFRWAPALADFDLDGDLDLFEATGHVYTESEAGPVGILADHAQAPNLMINDGTGVLTPLEPDLDDGLSQLRPARGISVADLDDDGRQDVVVAATYGSPLVLRNVQPPRGRWLAVRLVGDGLNREAAGAKVIASQGSQRWLRERVIGEGYLGNFDRRLFFALPEDGPVGLDLRWPDGHRQEVEVPAPEREVTVVYE